MTSIDFRLERINLDEQIAEKLENMILGKTIFNDSSSNKLPSEMSLAKQFNVSRTVIREAFRLLKERGLIIQKNGDGSYMTRPRVDTVSSAVSRIMRMDNIGNDDLREIREILELASARLAASNISIAQIEELEQIVKMMADLSLDIAQRVALDCKFHMVLAQGSGNELLTMFVEVMTVLIQDYMGKGVLVPGGIEDALQRHSKIINALHKRDVRLAEEAMQEHLTASYGIVKWFDTEKSNL